MKSVIFTVATIAGKIFAERIKREKEACEDAYYDYLDYIHTTNEELDSTPDVETVITTSSFKNINGTQSFKSETNIISNSSFSNATSNNVSLINVPERNFSSNFAVIKLPLENNTGLLNNFQSHENNRLPLISNIDRPETTLLAPTNNFSPMVNNLSQLSPLGLSVPRRSLPRINKIKKVRKQKYRVNKHFNWFGKRKRRQIFTRNNAAFKKVTLKFLLNNFPSEIYFAPYINVKMDASFSSNKNDVNIKNLKDNLQPELFILSKQDKDGCTLKLLCNIEAMPKNKLNSTEEILIRNIFR